MVLAVAVLNSGVGYLALKRLEKKAGAPIQGDFRPSPFLSSFVLRNSRFRWKTLLEIHSGTLSVRYDPLFLVPGRRLRVEIQGEGLTGKLLGKWAEREGVSEVRIEHLEADLAFGRGGPPEIYLIDVKAREFQFHFGEKEQK